VVFVFAAYGFALLVVGPPIGRKFRGSWRVAVLALAGMAITFNIVVSINLIAAGTDTDWRVLAEYGRRAGTPALYVFQADGEFRYSPLYAWVLVPLGWLGQWGFAALHLAVVPLFRSRRVAYLLLIGWPFWFDAVTGNVLVFVLLAAWWALQGNRVATFAYLALVLLMPRPLMAPLAIWILWQRPEWRWPFAAMLAINVALVLSTGLGDEWIPALLGGRENVTHSLNFAPSRFVGIFWLPIGALLTAWLLLRGRIGLASIAASPYLFPYYWLFVLLELRPPGAIPLPDASENTGASTRSGSSVPVFPP
jgi:hypothetical protein